jgi:transposase InsO family protein
MPITNSAQDSMSYGDRLFLAGLRHPATEALARRAVQKAARLLALSLGEGLRDLRESQNPLVQAYGFGREQSALARLLVQIVELLGSRLDKLPERRRPHYTPHQRWRILELRRLLALSADETAILFRVSTGTMFRWEAEAGREPDKKTVGSLLKPLPPVRRYADVVRHLVQLMDRVGFGGADKVGATLARAGWRLARETVRRYRHEPPVRPLPEPTRRPRARRSLKARCPNHIWLADITHVKGLFGLRSFKVAAVFDAFSRMPLALRVFRSEPAAQDILQLVFAAVRRHGAPRHFVSDQGAQFTAPALGRPLDTLGVRQRVGAIGEKGSIALLERYWRTLKHSLQLPFFRPLTQAILEERLAYVVEHYSFFRPHQALDGRTPAELFFSWPAACASAKSPTRACRGDAAPPLPLRIDFLDPDRRHPILVKAA